MDIKVISYGDLMRAGHEDGLGMLASAISLPFGQVSVVKTTDVQSPENGAFFAAKMEGVSVGLVNLLTAEVDSSTKLVGYGRNLSYALRCLFLAATHPPTSMPADEQVLMLYTPVLIVGSRTAPTQVIEIRR